MFAAGDARHPRVRPRGRGPVLPGRRGAFRCRICRVPRDDGNPGETTRLDYYPDDTSTPRHGDDTCVTRHTRTTTPPPRRHAAAPLAAGARSEPSIVERRDEAIRAERDAAPASIPAPAGGRCARPARGRVAAQTRGGTTKRCARRARRARARSAIPRMTSTRAGARFPRAFGNQNTRKLKTSRRLRRRRHRPPRASLPGRPRRARHASAHPGGAWRARPRTFGQAMRGDGHRRRSSRACCAGRAGRRRLETRVARVRETTRSTPHPTAVTAVKNRSSFCDR